MSKPLSPQDVALSKGTPRPSTPRDVRNVMGHVVNVWKGQVSR